LFQSLAEKRSPENVMGSQLKIAILLIGLLLVAGCQKKGSSLREKPAENPEPKAQQNAAEGVEDLRKELSALDEISQKLPGRDEGEHRQLVRDAMGQFVKVIRLLGGPQPSGTLRQQIQLIQSQRAMLRTGSEDMAVEPVIDTGLRAAYRALTQIQAASFNQSPEISQSLDQVRNNIDQLDLRRGALHRLVVTDVVRGFAGTARLMTDELEKRASGQPATAASE
jgi:hypothetical protein